MNHSKKVFIFLEVGLAVVVIVLAVNMFRGQLGKGSHKVSVVLQNSDASQWSALRYGLKMAAEDQGVELFFVSTEDELTVHEEIELVKYEIDHGADAVIVQPVPGTDMEAKLKKIAKKVPVMLVQCAASKDRNTSALPVTGPDNYAMGKTMAEEILADYSGNIQGKALGIIRADDSEAAASREHGVRDALKDTGAKLCWSVSGSFQKPGKNSLEDQPRVDLLIALDDLSLTTAGEYSTANNLHGALVYGIGNSTEAVYYLDTGVVECMVVPDDFLTGYQSLTEVAENLKHYFRKIKGKTLSYTVLHRRELFSKENQEILFTMSQ